MQNILEEIQSAKNFNNIRESLHPGVINGLVTSIIKQINSLKTIGPQDATVLSEALSDAPYGEAGTASVNATIDAALQNTLSTPQPSPDEPKQFLKNWWLTCTPTDWNTLRSNVPWSAKLTCLVERANSLGCTHPDEQCCKWMLALLLCACYSELPTPKERYNKLQELKNCVATERKVYPYEHLTTYPQKITDLPAHMWEYAYSAEGPLELDFPGVNLVADRIPLRKNSKLLKDHPSADTAARAAVSNSQIEIAGVCDLPTPALKNADQHVPANKAPPFSQDIVLSDPDEVALHAKFQAELWKLRAAKQGLLASSPQHTKEQPLVLKKSPDGSFVLSEACKGEPGAADHTGKGGYEPSNNNLEQPIADREEKPAGQDQAADHKYDLDQFSQAALKALQKMNTKKKKNSAETAKVMKTEPASAVACGVAHA